MPRTVMPSPAENGSSTQSLYAPTPSESGSAPSIASASERASSASVRVNGSVIRPPERSSAWSGPTIRERITLPFVRRSTVCSPPTNTAWPSPFVSVLKNENVPWLPRRSGTHIPESSSPFLNGTGGNVIGTRWMIEKMFLSPSSFQKC